MLGSRMDELVEPTGIQTLEIYRDLGGMKGIEKIVHNYQIGEKRQKK